MSEGPPPPKWPSILISSLLAILVSVAGMSYLELRDTGKQIVSTTAQLEEVIKRMDRREQVVNERLRRLEDKVWPR